MSMKRVLSLTAALVLSGPVLGNQVLIVSTRSSVTKLDAGRQQTDVLGSVRDIRLSLSVVTGRNAAPLQSIEGAVEGARFRVNVSDLPIIGDVRASQIWASADCCIFGATFSWYIPFGKAVMCEVTGASGKRVQRRVQKAVHVDVDGEGKVERVQVSDPCLSPGVPSTRHPHTGPR